MPKRTRNHIIEDIARASLRNIFSHLGWTVEDLNQDYGEDLLIRVFENNNATPWILFAQSKATDHINRYLINNGNIISFPIDSVHINHWSLFSEPVVLMIYDVKSGNTYWEIIQNYLDAVIDLPSESLGKTINIHIPIRNTLNSEGLRRLRNLTKKRFERFSSYQNGIQILIDALHDHWGVDVEHSPEKGVLILPCGTFVKDSSGDTTLVLFGNTYTMVDNLVSKTGLSPNEILHLALDNQLQIIETFKSGGVITIQDEYNTTKEIRTLEEYKEYMNKKSELDG
ncbi:MAG: DUF4365 domain-containing protein [Armatimonas sp.]